MNRANKSYAYVFVGGCLVILGVGIALIPVVSSSVALAKLGLYRKKK